MEMAPLASANDDSYSAFPDGYQALGTTQSVEKDASKVCLYTDAATVEVAALAPDLFRVGLFPHGRTVDYDSVAVMKRDWDVDRIAIEERSSEVTITTSFATAHLSLNPLRIGFTDYVGRAFALDDTQLGMGSFALPEQIPSLEAFNLLNPVGTLGTPTRVYKQHIAGSHYFGCGERTGEFDKTGSHQVFWNVDPLPGHTTLQNNLYVSIPFTVVLADGQAWGLFLDSTTRVEFDLAREEPHRSWFGTSNGNLVYYVFCGPTIQDVLARYTELTGHTPLPPLWSLGNGQSRFSYQSADEVRTIARTFRERDIPCDTLYLDIDVLDGYRVFTWDQKHFPDPAGLIAELRAMGFHVVCIVDAGVKVDEMYDVYTDGRERDLYCKSPQGQDYQNAVWPGICVFPDFTSTQTRIWWGEQHRVLLDAGVAGIWSDMNEPALFIPLNSTMPANVVHPGDGHVRLHVQVHNAYGSLMVRSTREGLLRLRPEQRPFIISRSGYAGIQRDAVVWTGDNSSTWEHLAMSVSQLLNLGLSGVGWAGVDIGGYYGDSNGELLARWTEFGIFQAFCRNHAEKQTCHQEPWVFGEPYETVCRAMLKLRQRLLPYLYTLFDECHRTGTPILRPLFWAYPNDPTCSTINDEVLCGNALLVAPITRPGTEHRHVYLPEGDWFHYWTGNHVTGPAHILAHAPLGQPALYVRANIVVPLWSALNSIADDYTDPLTLLLYPYQGSGRAILYEDAGNGYEYTNGMYARRSITCDSTPDCIRIIIGEQEGKFVASRMHRMLELRELANEPWSVLWNGESQFSWQYNLDRRCLVVELHETVAAQTIEIYT